MNVKLFGKQAVNEYPVHLEEVTLQLGPATARRIAKFLMECADEMDSSPHWEHRHLSDWCAAEDGDGEGAEIVVFREAE